MIWEMDGDVAKRMLCGITYVTKTNKKREVF